jgi:hypothetical protein
MNEIKIYYMKKYVTALILFLIFITARSQDFNRIIFDPESEEEILYGYCNREGLSSGQFGSWFEPEYESYMVDDSTMLTIDQDFFFTCNITVVLGTWCSDSQREVPRLFKILDHIGFPEDNLKLICIDRSKNAEGTNVSDLDIQLVPTIIFYQGDSEIGRIIESPEVSLESDIAGILKQ